MNLELEQAVYRLREDARMWAAIANADRDRWFGGSKDLHEHASLAAVRDLMMGIRRMLDRGFRDRKTDAPKEQGLVSIYRALEDAGHQAEGDRLRQLVEVVQLQNIADKSIAHGNLDGLRKMSSAIPGLKPTLSQPRLLFTAVSEISGAYQKHIRDVDFEAAYLPASRLLDPFRGQVQRAGVPWVDFHLTDIFLDRALLAPSLRSGPADLTDDQVVAYVVHWLRCAEYAQRGRHPVGLHTDDASRHYQARAVELLGAVPSDARAQIDARVRSAGFEPPAL